MKDYSIEEAIEIINSWMNHLWQIQSILILGMFKE